MCYHEHYYLLMDKDSMYDGAYSQVVLIKGGLLVGGKPDGASFFF
jgi:hypothetical protein